MVTHTSGPKRNTREILGIHSLCRVVVTARNRHSQLLRVQIGKARILQQVSALLRNLPAANPVNTAIIHHACGESAPVWYACSTAGSTDPTHKNNQALILQTVDAKYATQKLWGQRIPQAHKDSLHTRNTLILQHGVLQINTDALQPHCMHVGLHLMMHSDSDFVPGFAAGTHKPY